MVRLALREVRPRTFHLKGKHNQKSHGGHASSIPDVTDTVRLKGTSHEVVVTDYMSYKGEDWLRGEFVGKKKWQKADDVEVVKKGPGIDGSTTPTEKSHKPQDTTSLKTHPTGNFSVGDNIDETGVVTKIHPNGDFDVNESRFPAAWAKNFKKYEPTTASPKPPPTPKVDSSKTGSTATSASSDPSRKFSIKTDKDFEEHGKVWSSKLSSDESKAIEWYIGDAETTVNGPLRAGKVPPRVKHIDSALSKSTAPEDIVVYRGIRDDSIANLSVGARFRSEGFTSTSLNRNVARSYAILDHQVMEIRVPKGAKGAPLDASGFGTGAFSEWLIPRETRFRVVGKNGKVTVLEMELD